MSGTVTNLVNWVQSGGNSGSHTLNTGDIAGAAFSGGRCLLVLIVSAAGQGSLPSITSVVQGGDTTLVPAGSVSAWTQRALVTENGTNKGIVAIYTAIASKSFSGLDVAITFGSSTQEMAFSILAVQGMVEPITFVTATNTGTSSAASVTATAITDANSVQFGVAIGDGNTASPSLASGWTAGFTENVSTVGQAIGAYKINSTTQNPNSYSMASSTTSWPTWAAAIMSIVMGKAEGTATTALKRLAISAAGLSNAEVGTIATALKKISQSASGTVGASGETGTITTTLTKMSQSAAGSVSPAGTIATNLSRLSMSAAGNVAQAYGTITTNLFPISQDAEGAIATNVGQIVTALYGISQDLAAEEIVTGFAVTNLDNGLMMELHASALEVFTGTITTDLFPMSMSLEAQEVIVAQATTNLPIIMQEIDGEVRLEATIVTRLGRANLFMETFIEALQIIEGPIVTTLSGVETHALGGLMGSPGTGDWYSWRGPDS
jgi:hypothetical protein